MLRPLRILLAALVCIFAVQPPAIGSDDVHGGGGITIVPFCASAENDVEINLSPDMRGSAVRANVNGAWTNFAFMHGATLVMDGGVLQEIFRAGVTTFDIYVVSPTGRVIRISIVFDEDGDGCGRALVRNG